MQIYNVYNLPTGTVFVTQNGAQGKIIRHQGEKCIQWLAHGEIQAIADNTKMPLEIISQ